MKRDSQISNVVVIGGGTAGWLAANYLAKSLDAKGSNVSITLIESPNIPTIGVGEGTVPAMRDALQFIGLRETEFIRECDAAFKQSIRFDDWLYNPSEQHHHYYHVFDHPIAGGFDTTPYWVMGNVGKDLSYANSVSVQSSVCDAGLGPKMITTPEYQGLTSYAYHLDAAKFAKLLTKHATTVLGVKHLLGNVLDVKLDTTGSIISVLTDKHGELKGDFFIDCTGFASMLIGKKMEIPFVDKSDVLFVDNAIAIQVPYENPDDPIVPYTISLAKQAGWIWDIGLSSRRGTGYVYSSNYTDHDEAEKVLRDYIGPRAKDLNSRRIPMRIGYRDKFWYKNCVAIGLSQGFVEPLEATALLISNAACKMLADLFPTTYENIPLLAKQYNETLRYGWDRVIDFIKLHYCLTKRTDFPFWFDNTDRKSIPGSLLEKLESWSARVPNEYDFFSKFEIFHLENYLYVLYGMNFKTDLQPVRSRYKNVHIASKRLEDIKHYSAKLTQQLPNHRVLIDKIKEYGLHTC